ncbi:hypothetical protein FRC02_006935, partial [Tulasnella sp. 418]
MSSDTPIILYDIPSTNETKAFSPNTWRTRLVLNYKGISYETKWLSYPDVRPTLIEIGITPVNFRPDGTPMYTCPSITVQSPSESKFHLTDSAPIAEYLDANFAGPKVFPPGSKAAQHLFITHLQQHLLPNLGPLMIGLTPKILDSRSNEYYEPSRAGFYGCDLKDLWPAGPEREARWQTVQKDFDALATIYDKNEEGGGIYFMGSGPTYADMALVSILLWTKEMHTDRDGPHVDIVWDIIKEWNNGKWI